MPKLGHTADPLWELSSFSEAAMAAAQAPEMLPAPAPSQPRQGSTAPTLDFCRCQNLGHTADPLWELSSFSEAAMMAAQAPEMLPDPPPSQPRQGSTAPTLDFCRCQNSGTPPIPCGSCRASARLRWRRHRRQRCCLTHRHRSLARARQLPHLIFVAAKIPDLPPIPVGAVELQRGCDGGGTGARDRVRTAGCI